MNKDKIKDFFSREDRGRFWLHMVVVGIGLWALSGVVSIFKPQGVPYLINEIVGGFGPCLVMYSAILSLTEKKKNRGVLEKKQILGEDMIAALFAAVIIFAEVIAASSGRVAYDVPLTLAAVGVEFCFWIAGPKFRAKEKIDMVGILKIIVFGAAASVILAKFFVQASEILAQIGA